jgi:hypothetical protein
MISDSWVIRLIETQLILALIPYVWKTIKYPIRFLWFFVYNYIRHTKLTPLWINCKIEFTDVKENQDYRKRLIRFTMTGCYELSEFEKRNIWCKYHRRWERKN